MRRLLIAEEWIKFRSAFLHKDAPEVQITDMRRAFYGGVSVLYRLLVDLAPGTEPTAADLRMMDDIDHELKQFVRDVKKGVA